MPNWRRSKQPIFLSKVTYVGGMFILSFGLFVLTIGFKLEHMLNPLSELVAAGGNS